MCSMYSKKRGGLTCCYDGQEADPPGLSLEKNGHVERDQGNSCREGQGFPQEAVKSMTIYNQNGPQSSTHHFIWLW